MAAIRAEQLAVEDEILPERLGRLEAVPRDDLAQRLDVVAHAVSSAERRAFGRHADRRGHRARVGAVLAGDVERGAMVGRGADDRQAQA